jgi:hypothetical protein
VIGPFVLVALLRASGPEFESNSGQADARYSYLARVGPTRAYFENDAVEFRTDAGRNVRLSWTGAATQSGDNGWEASEPTGNVFYYCNQSNTDLCRKPVQGYGRLIRKDLYPKTDWVLYGRERRFEYDLIVHPGAKLEDARLRVEGAEARLNPDGSLQAGDLLLWRPDAYQWSGGTRLEVKAWLEPRGDGEFSFAVGPYRADLDLTIDPVVVPIGVAGGSDEDAIAGTVTGNSCSFRYGTTRSADWSRLPGTGHSVFAQLSRPGLGTQNVFGAEMATPRSAAPITISITAGCM